MSIKMILRHLLHIFMFQLNSKMRRPIKVTINYEKINEKQNLISRSPLIFISDSKDAGGGR